MIVYSELWWEDDPMWEEKVEFYAIFKNCPLLDQLVEYYYMGQRIGSLGDSESTKRGRGRYK